VTPAPIITFLSDYGLSDDFVGVCHGVMVGLCPGARVIDVTHGVPRGDVRAGALVLRGALPYLPVGVHLAVVDPGVGGARRAVALRLADGRVLVGPDNGLLSLCFEVGGGVVEAVDIGASRFALELVSATFHGRDIFAPVAARVAAGALLPEAGEPINPGGLVGIDLTRARVVDGVLVAQAIYVDAFGNVQLDVEEPERFGVELGRELVVEAPAAGAAARARCVRTFSEARAGELLLYVDAYRRLALAVNQGSAAARMAIGVGDELRVRLP
jgi:S-adenosyl-L-methionine hydrolase (adenosine-forming)